MWDGARSVGQSAAKWARGIRRLTQDPEAGKVMIYDRDGVRYMTFGTEWVQGAMRLSRPDWPELEYVRQMMVWMLFVEEPTRIVQLGLGTGALAKFCLKRFPMAFVDVAEIDAGVVEACRIHFRLPQSPHLSVSVRDALDFANDATQWGRASVLQVDVYDAQARGPALDSEEFYEACARCLAKGGWACVNLFGDDPGFQASFDRIAKAFGTAWVLGSPGEGNVVVLAGREVGTLDMEAAFARAEAIERETGLEAGAWVRGLTSQL